MSAEKLKKFVKKLSCIEKPERNYDFLTENILGKQGEEISPIVHYTGGVVIGAVFGHAGVVGNSAEELMANLEEKTKNSSY